MRATVDLPDPQTASTLPGAVLSELAIGSDWLGTWWPPILVAALAAALTARALRRGPRRHDGPAPERTGRPVRRRWLTIAGAVGAALLASGLAVNTAIGYVPSVPAARLLLTGTHQGVTAQAGNVTSLAVPVPATLRMPPSRTWVYTPPGYDASGPARYPVVYLVHGTPGGSADWFAGGAVGHVMDVLIENGLVRPMIIVAPDVNGRGQDDTECLDSTRDGSQVETYLDDVVVPWVDAHYATQADWQHRAIGGMSAGGFCALDQGLRHQDLYGAVIALEPYDSPGSGGRAMLSTQAQYDARSPGRYLPTMTFTHPVPTFLDTGEQARNGDGRETARVAGQLIARGQEVLFREEPGQGHTWTMARTGIPYGLVFVSDHLSS